MTRRSPWAATRSSRSRRRRDGVLFLQQRGRRGAGGPRSRADRVAIFDWDVHHGNGTQDIFYDRADVFYASIHEDGLYPGTGDISETGTGDADGRLST